MKQETRNKKQETRKKIISTVATTVALGVFGCSTVFGASFGSSKCGASSVEIAQFIYKGSAWNYKGSGYKYAEFKYTRNGKVLMHKVAHNGKVTGYVTDDLRWGDKYVTHFKWNRKK
ncbi:hypothetical protein [Lachnobacterium bovis]|uniref:hypothetical protein n=1 Tax=Lachnobacterium bovis TaxID=140626 RepID=UPI0003B61478|nr:hypothetical protein [Lachnobacterium bovis]